MSVAAGVDGCRGGWIVILHDLRNNAWTDTLCPNFIDVVNLRPQPDMVAVDMPIGLLATSVAGGRDCEQIARDRLGSPRKNSVFSSPSRNALQGANFVAATQLNGSIGLSQQSFALFPKLRQVDNAMSPQLQTRIREVHPELCFYGANGESPITDGKKTPQGQNSRLNLLASCFGQTWLLHWEKLQSKYSKSSVGLDDLLDAGIATWTAERILSGQANCIPSNPPCDAEGLRMEMWY